MEEAEADKTAEPVINPEFQDLLDVQSEISYDELKKMIEAEGIRDPVVVWKETEPDCGWPQPH